MTIVQTILQHLGISQRNLATLVNTNDSLLSRYETATRTLPASTMLQLAQIQSLLSVQQTVPPPTPTEQALLTMQQQAAYCTAQAATLQVQLTNMQKSYQQAQALRQLMEDLPNTMTNITPQQTRTIEELHYQATKKIDATNWLAQQQLQQKITLLQHEAALCSQP